MPERSTSSSLRPLLLLESATLLSGAGNGAALVVLPWLVLERTGSAGSAGVLAAATAIPLLASSLFSGTVVDTFGRRRTAIGSDLLSAASVAAIPIVDHLIGLDMAWLVALAVIGAVFDPAGVTARETMLPAAAGRAGWALERANGVHEAVWGVAFLLGPGMGGVLIAWVGAVNALWVTAIGFTSSALMLALLQVPMSGAPVSDAEPDSMWRQTTDGLRFVWRDPLLFALTAAIAVLVSVYMPIEGVLLPVEFEAQDQPGRLGIIVMAMSAGGVAGALLYGLFARRIRRSLVFRGAFLVTATLVLVLAFMPPIAVMVVVAFFIGVAYGPVGPILNLAMQTRSPEHMRGRVVGIISSAEYAAGPVGYLIVGFATEHLGVRTTFLAVAGVIMVVALATLAVRSLRDLDGLASSIEEPSNLAEVLDVATGGAAPLIMPPRDPDHTEHRSG
ncbi:MAG: MFS transporter [Propionicimonas sp.]|nr:MFS transporter [Propionicimonas sp.]